MRITSVSLYSSENVEAITFNLRNPDPEDQYMIRAMAGLDSEEIIPRFYGYGLTSKTKYYDFGMKARDVVIRAVLNPRFILNETYSDIRDRLYKTISATRNGKITLNFSSGTTIVAKIEGFITKFEVPYFSQLPEVQLTVRCDDPMFRAINAVVFLPANLPTVNPIILPDSLSTAPHGFSMQVTFKTNTPSFTIQDVPTNPEWKFKIIPNGGFLTNDVLYFSSEFTNKYCYIVRSGATTYLIDRIETGSLWPLIFPGQNTFHFVDIAAINWNRIEYYASYWGV
ncbi:MAG: hypothetical protein ABWY25_06175 [Paenisporosarcina sp.]